MKNIYELKTLAGLLVSGLIVSATVLLVKKQAQLPSLSADPNLSLLTTQSSKSNIVVNKLENAFRKLESIEVAQGVGQVASQKQGSVAVFKSIKDDTSKPAQTVSKALQKGSNSRKTNIKNAATEEKAVANKKKETAGGNVGGKTLEPTGQRKKSVPTVRTDAGELSGRYLSEGASLYTALTMSGNVTDDSASGGSRSLSLSLSPSYSFRDGSYLSANVSLIQQLNIEGLNNSDTDLSYTFRSRTWKNTTLIPSLGATLPTNSDNYSDNSYRGSLALSSAVVQKVTPITFPLLLSYSIYGAKNFHQFRQNNLGSANTELFLSHRVALAKIISKWRLSVSGTLTPSWSYNGDYSNSFNISQAITYRDKGFTYTLSHSNGGSALNYQGQLSELRVFDDYNSRLSFTLGYSIQ